LLESYSMTDLEDFNTNEETFIVKKCFLLKRKVTKKQSHTHIYINKYMKMAFSF
jgi:hypothetical protein